MLYALAALAMGGAPALAQTFFNVNVTVPAGGHYLYGFTSINPDCSLLGYAAVRVTTPPANGVVRAYKGTVFPNFSANNPRSACNGRRMPGTQIEYRPRPGFVGSDSFFLDVILPDGVEKTASYNVTVK
jgi:hypothetical protein